MFREYIRKMEEHADQLLISDFHREMVWFNSSPLSFNEELKGKIVILFFWTSSCINCAHVLPDLRDLEKKYHNLPIVFIGVHSPRYTNEKNPEVVRQAIIRNEIKNPVVSDAEMEYWKQLGIQSWPTIVVISPHRSLLFSVAGEGNREYLDQFITSAFKYYDPNLFNHNPIKLKLEEDRFTHDSNLCFPGRLAIDFNSGQLFISDCMNHRILITDLEGNYKESIGGREKGLQDGSFSQAKFNSPEGLCIYNHSLFVADNGNHAIREINLKERKVVTLVGNGKQGVDFLGGQKGSLQQLNSPMDLVITDNGQRMYISMAGSHQIWEYDFLLDRARNFSGTGKEQHLNGTTALTSAWAKPCGLYLIDNILFVADSDSNSIRGIYLDTFDTETFAGGDPLMPENLYSYGDVDGKGVYAKLQHPKNIIWWKREEKLIIADSYNHRLKLLDPKTKLVKSWIGSGKAGRKDGMGLHAEFFEPTGLVLNEIKQLLYVADTNNHSIRVVNLDSGQVSTLKLKGVLTPAKIENPKAPRLTTGSKSTQINKIGPVKMRFATEGVFALRIRLPQKYKSSKEVRVVWQVLNMPDLPIVISKDNSLGSTVGEKEIFIPFRFKTHSKKAFVIVEAISYYCKETEGQISLLGEAVFEVELEEGEGTNVLIPLEYSFE